jgi:ArsR family transcriptional regulator
VKSRLQRLISTGICATEDASKYEAELKELINTKIDKELIKYQSKLFKALSDPIRLKILKLLAIREMCVCEIMVALDLTQPTSSHHLEILEDVDLIESRKEGKWVFFKLTKPQMIKLIEKFSAN